MAGFPLGTPAGPPVDPTLSGTLHLISAGFGFLALVGATFVLARRFLAGGRPARAGYSIATGVAFLGSFAAISSGSPSPAVNLVFTAGVLLAWGWLTVTSVHLYHQS